MSARVHLDRDRLVAICRNYHVHRLAVFGSALRDDFRPDSDVDLLIEFDSGFRLGLTGLHALEQELSAAFGCRRIDMANPKYLNRRVPERVLNEAEVQFAEG